MLLVDDDPFEAPYVRSRSCQFGRPEVSQDLISRIVEETLLKVYKRC